MKYGFIGCGNMGGALAKAVSKVTKDILVSDRDEEKAREAAASLGCKVGTNDEIATNCDRIFLGVKPQVMQSVLDDIKGILSEKDPIIITMAAGLSMKKIASFLGYHARIIRIMPNTPVLLGAGTTLYSYNDRITDDVIASFVDDMRYSGIVEYLPEELIDAGCSLSGCGPAYMYMMVDAVAEGAVQCGLSREQAIRFAASTMKGAAEMVLNTDEDPEILKQRVCSPGGSTIEGVKSLDAHNFRDICIDAIKCAYKRNKELGQ
jgi:pyrroline-5-carboxylate reductase